MKLKVYGIKNCDSMRKTFRWLDRKGTNYTFIDFTISKPTKLEVKSWLDKIGDSLVNTRSTTYRQLPDETKRNFSGEKRLDAILNAPTLIKRPLLVKGDIILVGFLPDVWTQIENLLTE